MMSRRRRDLSRSRWQRSISARVAGSQIFCHIQVEGFNTTTGLGRSSRTTHIARRGVNRHASISQDYAAVALRAMFNAAKAVAAILAGI
jgi:hypothetical protein